MKRGLRLLGIVFVGFLLGLFAMTQAKADDDYTITHYNVNVHVLNNGDAAVEQRITYDFDGTFHGVYYNQDTKGIGDLTNPTVSVVHDGQTTQLSQNDSQLANTFTTTESNNLYKMKVYYPIQDAQATFIYRYHLSRVVTNYQDTAELNWKVIGTGWDQPLHDVAIHIQLPAQPINKLQAWTHGPLNGQTTVSKKNGTVAMKVDRVPAATAVESHLLFPTSVTSANLNTKTTKHLKTAQHQEAQLAKQANEQRTRRRMIPIALFVGFALVSVGHLLIQMRWFSRHRASRVTDIPLVHHFDIPEYPAAMAQSILTREKPNSKAFSAWLMELAAAGELTITPEDGVFPTYRLTETDKLTPAHRDDPLLQFVLRQIGQENSTSHHYSVTLQDIKQYKAADADDEQQLLSTHFEAWQQDQFAQVKALDYFDKLSPKIMSHAWGLLIANGLMILGMSLSAVFIYYSRLRWTDLVVTGVMLILTLVVGVQHLRHLPKYTEAGNQVAMSIKGFRLMLKDMGHFERSQIGDLILWEQILPYAVAFGLAKQVVKTLKANFSEDELRDSMPLVYPLFFYGDFGGATFSADFNSNFGSVINSEMSSIDGGSGGFSGGSSGGFGGGSGGGAF